jgi:hydrogenase nickel incorporation protein HypA/HybF
MDGTREQRSMGPSFSPECRQGGLVIARHPDVTTHPAMKTPAPSRETPSLVLTVCRELLEDLDQLVRVHQPRAVARVEVGVGAVAGVEPAQLAETFAGLCVSGLVRPATLAVENLPLRLRCGECGADVLGEAPELPCIECGASRRVLAGGDEVILMRVELEVGR